MFMHVDMLINNKALPKAYIDPRVITDYFDENILMNNTALPLD